MVLQHSTEPWKGWPGGDTPGLIPTSEEDPALLSQPLRIGWGGQMADGDSQLWVSGLRSVVP